MSREKIKETMNRLDQELDLYRDEVIEEVAQAIEKFSIPFGTDTVASFAVFVRGLKNDRGTE